MKPQYQNSKEIQQKNAKYLSKGQKLSDYSTER